LKSQPVWREMQETWGTQQYLPGYLIGAAPLAQKIEEA
jgi:hypothetical protein